MQYEERKFALPSLLGMSKDGVDQHLALYAGYVKNFNAISSSMPEYAKDLEKNGLALSELVRRRSFEFDGMRLHEHYFEQLEGGTTPMQADSALAKQFEKEYHKPEYFLEYFKMIAGVRGPGWAILYWDAEAAQFLAGFVGEQHQGHFATLPIILALDVWEHAYILDHGASGRGKYIDAFLKNLNWSVIEKRFDTLQK